MPLQAKARILRPGGMAFPRPRRAPGFNAGHLAAGANTRLSVLSVFEQDPPLVLAGPGPMTRVGNAANTQSANIPGIGCAHTSFGGAAGYSVAIGGGIPADTTFTAAWVFFPYTAQNLLCMISSNSTHNATGGVVCGFSESGGLKMLISEPFSGNFRQGPLLQVGYPYFCILSCNGSASSFVAVNLISGAIQTSTSGGLSFIAGDGTYTYGGGAGYPFGRIAYEACAMLSTADLRQADLLAIAADPWRFWFP